ncbi:class A beta-lactamase-related serine hydrolase [Hymenobacter sp. BT175]|uniref:serine hydrolase n=1 Tax=Hymenobacter translucens TaxID=2886507 RepID=UPI001D0F0598|nr:serine hydrolase [Hymenobacter translucens]MCC2546208.1 class A beta-lactamase-related serine hydrolase [Hymenobacter translucens]
MASVRLLGFYPLVVLLYELLAAGFFVSSPVAAQAPAPNPTPTDSPLLDSLLHTDAQLTAVARRAASYELQIIYTQINRDARNQPAFVRHTYRLDARQYFNPASLVKLPVVALSLEKLNQLRQPGLSLNSPMATGVAFRCQTPAPHRPGADAERVNNVGNYARRMLLVSDNTAYNRLYEFLGQRPLNERLWALGYPAARIVRRFAPCDTAANRHTNPISFYNKDGEKVYQQPAAVNTRSLGYPLGSIRKGRGYQSGGRIVAEPYDFTTANYLPLADITGMLQAVLFPETVEASRRFSLTSADYAFLRYYLQATPHGSGYRPYAAAGYFDAYKKYLYYGRRPEAKAQPGLRVYNIVGMSHGYLADVAYFADSVRQTEFMLSAVLYVNKDGIINDGRYEYASVGLPFLARLGQVVGEYENRRKRVFKPDFGALFTFP